MDRRYGQSGHPGPRRKPRHARAPFGGIFDQPEPDSPAAAAGIEQGDVLTQINGSSLPRASDFANIISAMPPGTQVSLWTLRNGQTMQLNVILGSTQCRQRG